MSTSEKPRDVSGVELLMNNHQGHKAEIDAREDNFGDLYRYSRPGCSMDIYNLLSFQLGKGTVIIESLCLK